MGRVGSLTCDPLRLAGPATVGVAMRQLQRAASHVSPLGAADESVALLTCARLEALLGPPRGDHALAAALDRLGEAVDEAATSRPGMRRTPADRRAAPPAIPTTSQRVRPMPDTGHNARLRSPLRRDGAARRHLRAVGSLDQEAPTPRSTGSPPSPRDVRGLEWLVRDAPVLRDAAAGTLDLAATAVRAEVLGAATVPTSRPTLTPDEPVTGVRALSLPAQIEQAQRPDLPSQPRAVSAVRPSDAPIIHSGTPAGDAGSALESLVRAWSAEQPAQHRTAALSVLESEEVAGSPEAGTFVVDGHDAPAPDSLRSGRSGAPRGEQVLDDDLLGLRDEVGRMLVAELRRYGIEVGP